MRAAVCRFPPSRIPWSGVLEKGAHPPAQAVLWHSWRGIPIWCVFFHGLGTSESFAPADSNSTRLCIRVGCRFGVRKGYRVGCEWGSLRGSVWCRTRRRNGEYMGGEPPTCYTFPSPPREKPGATKQRSSHRPSDEGWQRCWQRCWQGAGKAFEVRATVVEPGGEGLSAGDGAYRGRLGKRHVMVRYVHRSTAIIWAGQTITTMEQADDE